MPLRSALPDRVLPDLPSIATGGLLARRRFRAMNTDIEIAIADWRRGHLLDNAERVFHDVERRFSRFLPESELSRFNARADAAFEASDAFIDLLERAIELSRLTDGVFDPAILPALEAAGYDRSFELLADSRQQRPPVPNADATIASVRIDRAMHTVSAPAGLRLDLGGIGKGYAVDLAARELAPAQNFMLNAGGDIFASADGPAGGGWDVGVANPRDLAHNIEVVRLRDAAIATSSVAKRRWLRDGRLQTHIIDPRTCLPVETEVVSVSVIARTATLADVFAKTALLLGAEAGSDWICRHGVAALFVMQDGAVVRSPGWPSPAGNGVN